MSDPVVSLHDQPDQSKPAPALEEGRRRCWQCDDCVAFGEGSSIVVVEDAAISHSKRHQHVVTFWWSDSSEPAPYRREPNVIDADHLAHQREWSLWTFGPGARTLGVLDHIRSELKEIEDDPADLKEWVDVIILAFDGAWRAGWEPQQIIDAIKAKQAKNEDRTWPDWRTQSADQRIEHDRSVPE